MGDRENYVIHYLDGQAASEVLVVVGVKQTVPQNLFLVWHKVYHAQMTADALNFAKGVSISKR